MYNLILLYLNRLDNTCYKNSYKAEEYYIMNKIVFDRLEYKGIRMFGEQMDNIYNYRDIDTYRGVNICGGIHYIYDIVDGSISSINWSKYWFYTLI